ncbi:uncharacterized protein RCC_09343 [Ramularia collo-cygni]|uniref:BZIP domain-containing protein n=1 Tax=Ramularia collo-cygni TaxID=112498 RepID=A0A2D3VJX0_9PEZI|nr:uncharacterized protein RCC_09343 [Ramularia collo-cygni]CZT23629.1 uncharacterized protein RCC_09343 [Ramularia collo-cygni]
MTASFYPGLVPDFDDTAFEPNAGYMFDDSSAMDNFQREMEAPYDGSNGVQSGHPERSASMAWADHMGMSSNESQQDLPQQTLPSRGFPFHHGHGEPSAITPVWRQSDNSASQAQGGANGVSTRFGQVTPVTSQSRSSSIKSDDAQQQRIAQSNAKSERARNAANHRHSQTKQARDLLRKGRKSSAGRREDDEEEEDKSRGAGKQEYREKNRQAAAKCRRKKKDSTEVLESTARTAVEENTRLKNMVRHLRDQYSDLRTKALAHDGCGCTDIHQYNADQAQQAARGHVGNPPLMARDLQAMQAFQGFPNMPAMQLPLLGSMAMPNMSMGTSQPCAHAFSGGLHPNMAMQPSQHARSDSKHGDFEQQAAALQLCGQEFAFDPSLDAIQEDGHNDEFQ